MHKLIPISSILSIALLAGCTTSNTVNTNEPIQVEQTATETTSNTNEATDVAENKNSNETNTDEVDTSDWLTYTNEEYGFSFKYPEDWEINIEQTQLESRILENSSIYVIQLLKNDELQLAVLPEGQIDHGLGSNVEITTDIIDNKTITVLSSDSYKVYKFDNYPKENSEFRFESNINSTVEKVIIETIVKSVDFKS